MARTLTAEAKALKRAVAANKNITSRQLEQTHGISARELQDRLAMLLSFPDRMLQMIDDEVLPWAAARQALVFVGKDHHHSSELAALSRRLGVLANAEYFSGRLTSMNVTRKIYEVIFHGRPAARWQQFDEPIQFGEVVKEAPLFDAAVFKIEHRNTLHRVPKLWRKGKVRTFTCAGAAWLAEQVKATEMVRIEPPAHEEESVSAEAIEDLVDCTDASDREETFITPIRPLRRCSEGLPNDFEDHWHIQWPDEWGSEDWINESPAFLESALEEMAAFQKEHNLTNWWLVWHEYTRPEELRPTEGSPTIHQPNL